MNTIPRGLKAEAVSQAKEAVYLGLQDEYLQSMQDHRKLKKGYAIALLVLLFFQTFAVYGIAILQGIHAIFLAGYELEMIISGTLAQVAGLLYLIVKNLFPQIK